MVESFCTKFGLKDKTYRKQNSSAFIVQVQGIKSSEHFLQTICWTFVQKLRGCTFKGSNSIKYVYVPF